MLQEPEHLCHVPLPLAFSTPSKRTQGKACLQLLLGCFRIGVPRRDPLPPKQGSQHPSPGLLATGSLPVLRLLAALSSSSHQVWGRSSGGQEVGREGSHPCCLRPRPSCLPPLHAPSWTAPLPSCLLRASWILPIQSAPKSATSPSAAPQTWPSSLQPLLVCGWVAFSLTHSLPPLTSAPLHLHSALGQHSCLP